MADIVSNRQKLNDIEIAANAPLTEQLFNKMGANLNDYLDKTNNYLEFLANDTWTAPDANAGDPYWVILQGSGGGGGGGGGGGSGAWGGRGGVGAPIYTVPFLVTPSVVYTIVIGTGGAGGAGGGAGAGTRGTAGTVTTFGTITFAPGTGGLGGDGSGIPGRYATEAVPGSHFGGGAIPEYGSGQSGLRSIYAAGGGSSSSSGGGGASFAAGGAGSDTTGASAAANSGAGGGGGINAGGAGGSGRLRIYWYGNAT